MNKEVTNEGSAPGRTDWVRLGVLFGLLSVASLVLFAPIGVSTTYPRVVGEALTRIAPDFVAHSPYLQLVGGALRGETMLVAGLLLGGFLASRFGRKATGTCRIEPVHAREKSVRSRYLHAFLGGFLILFGARLAGGCTSGHVISGIIQLSVSGLVFGAGVFATGIATAKLMRREA
jgi:uncharacterized membrane protein YedE/YeeE